MADERYLVPPVERGVTPLVVRRVERRERQKNEEHLQEQPESGKKHKEVHTPTESELKKIKSEHKVDCKI